MVDTTVERVVLARHTTPNGEIQLQQRRLADGTPVFEIISNGVFLMASYNQISERALAQLAFESIPAGGDLRVLIGGLGMGFTLQEALVPNMAAIDVVEISPYIAAWNQTHFALLNGKVLSDSRVNLIEDDIYTVLCATPVATYHAILLDVDNGPSWLAHPDNARLYTLEALKRWSELLPPGGCLAVWSAQPEPEFLSRLQTVFHHAEEVCMQVPGPKKEPVENFIYRACGV